MEDAQDFSWASAKVCHAVILCRMEEGKHKCADTMALDRRSVTTIKTMYRGETVQTCLQHLQWCSSGQRM